MMGNLPLSNHKFNYDGIFNYFQSNSSSYHHPTHTSYITNNCFAVPYNASFNNQSFVSTCPNVPRNSNFYNFSNNSQLVPGSQLVVPEASHHIPPSSGSLNQVLHLQNLSPSMSSVNIKKPVPGTNGWLPSTEQNLDGHTLSKNCFAQRFLRISPHRSTLPTPIRGLQEYTLL